MRTRIVLAVSAALLVGSLVAVPAGSIDLHTGLPVAFDEEPRDCLELTPASLSLSGVTDDGDVIPLRVKVLYEQTTKKVANDIMALAARSYEGASIELTWSLQKARFDGREADDLIRQAKRRFNSKPPRGFDLVYVLTGKDIKLGTNTGVAGLADCIGGVKYPEHSFGVGEVITNDHTQAGGVALVRNKSAKVAAHEIGHLMGAHHHYANCLEGIPDEALEAELSACTLMINVVDLASISFGTPNNLVVRGHADDYVR